MADPKVQPDPLSCASAIQMLYLSILDARGTRDWTAQLLAVACARLVLVVSALGSISSTGSSVSVLMLLLLLRGELGKASAEDG